jgi:Glycoside hydrolase family 44
MDGKYMESPQRPLAAQAPALRHAISIGGLALLGLLSGSVGAVEASSGTAAPEGIVVTIDNNSRKPISPFVYGFNRFPGTAQPQKIFTLDRAGGNRWTAYNWETNASNAGSDYNFQNDAYFGNGPPAETVRRYIESDQKERIASLITVQLQGLVAADTAGPVAVTPAVDMKRFKEVVFEKASLSAEPFTETPPVTDRYVYMDEFVWAIDKKFPNRDIFGPNPKSAPVFVSLDNEPELWNSTHKEIQGANLVPPELYIHKSLRLAEALKAQFPNMVIFAPAHYGFYGIFGWQGGVKATVDGPDWFADRYARAVQSASKAAGRLLVDVYDVHWYTEATDSGGHRVTQLTGPVLSDDQVQALVQSPRSLSDPTYVERSWITKSINAPINLLARLQAKLRVAAPGMKIAVTEYNSGGGQHIAGTITQADMLGIFGATGVFAACLWPMSDNEPYIAAGFRAFRNFDGAGSNFGDIGLATKSSDLEKVSAYASADGAHPGRTIVVLINKSPAPRPLTVVGLKDGATARVFRMSAEVADRAKGPAPVAVGGRMPVTAAWHVTLPALSVSTIEVVN